MSYVKPIKAAIRGRFNSKVSVESTVNGKRLTFNGNMGSTINGSVQSQLVIPAADAGIPVIEFDGYGDTITKGTTVGSEGSQGSSAKFIGFKNTGFCSIELSFKTNQWKQNSSPGAADQECTASGDFKKECNISMLLHPGEYMTLPTNRMLVYNLNDIAVEHSAAEGVKQEDILLGVTDAQGKLAQQLGPSPVPAGGFVPGSIFLTFARPAYAPLGIAETVISGTSSGLTADTAYDFAITVDGVDQADMSFTTDATDVTWGGQNGVIKKINDALRAAGHDVRAGIARDNVLYDTDDQGDVVLKHNKAIVGTSTIEWKLDASGSNTNFFGSGKVPAIGSVPADVTPSEITDSTPYIMKDDGHGNLSRMNGGTGIMNYKQAAPMWTLEGCPVHSSVYLYCKCSAAHAGATVSASSGRNMLTQVSAIAITPHDNEFSHIDGSLETTIFT